MNKSFEHILNKHIENEHLVNQMIVTAFVLTNDLPLNNNLLLKEHILSPSNPYCLEIMGITSDFSFEQLIEAFEVAIPQKDIQVNGAVYTPKVIKDFIVEKVLSKTYNPLTEIIGSDISCGCGAFLYSLAVEIHKRTKKSIQSIIKTQIYGLDISDSSITRCKLLLSLLALSKGEDPAVIDFNLFVGNALEFDWNEIPRIAANNGFDIVVGNPPYVRAKHIDKDSKKLLSKWEVTKSGNPDLYIPFFEIGLTNLKQQGVLGYITVNSFFKSVNARSLRNYFEKEKVSLEIIDFGHEQIFTNKLTYTCLCFASKKIAKSIKYVKSKLSHLSSFQESKYHSINYTSLNSHRGWLLNNPKSISNIKRIESCGSPLGEMYIIKNGIATLSNSTYIFRPRDESKEYYHLERNGKTHLIEKDICRDIIKPNILKYEHEIEDVKEKLIYPYTNGITPLSLMKENVFKSQYPNAYQYLLQHKKLLAQRDKGNGDYGAWYAYGRTQALNDQGLKLLFPYMAKQPHFVFTNDQEMLIYCGYAIFSDDEKELLVLKKLLESRVFEYYMQNTSKPYASGYFSYAKNYVKHFGVCELSDREKKSVLQTKSKNELDNFFINKYRLSL